MFAYSDGNINQTAESWWRSIRDLAANFGVVVATFRDVVAHVLEMW